MRRWIYVLSEAGSGLVRNLWMTVAVVLSVTVSLALLGASVLLRVQIEQIFEQWSDQIEVSIFLCDEDSECAAITPDQRAQLEADLRSHPLVESVGFTTKEEAFESFNELYGDVEVLSDSVDETQLPASFRVRLIDPQDASAIVDQFASRPGILQVEDQLEFVQPFLQAARTFQYGALGVAIVQMVAATLLVANTVRVAAVARREETQIMKLVGASNWYIRLPFILEGVIAGLIGAAVSWVMLAWAVPWGIENLSGTFQFIPFLTDAEVYGVWPWLVGPAVAITGLSSTAALWGFLDV